MTYPITRYTLLPFIRKHITSIHGLEYLPSTPTFIVAANHISQIDALAIVAILFPFYKKKIHFFTRQNRYTNFFNTHVARKWAGCIFINNHDKQASIHQGVHLLNNNNIVGIFPEGERDSRVVQQTLLKGKTGVARLALNTGKLVLPIGIKTVAEPHRIDNEGELYSHYHDAIKLFLFKKTSISIFIGKPIQFTKTNKSQFNYSLLQKSTDRIMKSISLLCGKTYPYR